TSRDSDILSNIPASEQGNYEITYYDDETGALTQDPNSLIANPATYSITTTTVVYYRLDYDYGALGIAPVDDCYDVVPLEIVIGEEPNTPATVVDLETCGNGGTGEFNLEDRLSDIFSGLTQSDYTWEFYDDFTAADTQDTTQEITAPTTYTGANGATIYVRVMNEDNCHKITTFDLVVNQLNYNTPVMLSECDTDPQDGFTSFDLTQASNQIAGGNANITATYYFTQAGAENQTASDQLPSPINNFTNTDQDNQTVYVYIEDTSVNCGVVEPLSLEVIPSPVANAAGPLFVCDDDEDGQAQFDLGALDNTIDGGASNVTVSYHASQAFAN
ncbi:hypothetical protein ACFFGL_13670, partial [Mesonia maritima]